MKPRRIGGRRSSTVCLTLCLGIFFTLCRTSNAWVVPDRLIAPPVGTGRLSNRPIAVLSTVRSHSAVPVHPSLSQTHRRRSGLPLTTNNRNSSSSRSRVVLSMYNLPNGGGGKNKILEIVQSVLLLAVTVAFFLSPVGAFVIGLFNSFLFLSFLLPLVGTVSFQIWRYFNMIDGVCPNCGAPASVLKSKDNEPDQVSVCFNCGAALQASIDNQGIVNVSGRNSVVDDAFDSSPFGGRGGLFDIFGNDDPSYTTTTTTTTTDIYDEPPRQNRRDRQTIIDVEAKVDDSDDHNDNDKNRYNPFKPWQ